MYGLHLGPYGPTYGAISQSKRVPVVVHAPAGDCVVRVSEEAGVVKEDVDDERRVLRMHTQ